MTIPYQILRGAPQPLHAVAINTVALSATANINTYASFPTPIILAEVLPARDWQVLFLLSAHIDIETNNAECALALEFSGVTTIPAGSNSQDRLHVVCKSPISATFSLARTAILQEGSTTIELKYAGSAFNAEDISFDIIPFAAIAYK